MSSTNYFPHHGLPEQSILSIDEYVSMLEALGKRERYEILTLLLQGKRSIDELAQSLGKSKENIESHLDALTEVGLVSHRYRRESGADELYSYYEATSLGEAVISRGIGQLIREEREALLSAIDTTDEVEQFHKQLTRHRERIEIQDARLSTIETTLDRNLYQPLALGIGSMTAVLGIVHAASGSLASIPIVLLSAMFWVGLWLLRQ